MTEKERAQASGTPTDVLEVFGLKLQVYNPRLAELLTMEARDALQSDVGELVKGKAADDEAAQDAPAFVEVDPEPGLRESMDEVGSALGFELAHDGTWESPTGVHVLVRRIERTMSLDEAMREARELSMAQQAAGHDTAALFVVDDQVAVDTFRVAIRKEKLFSEMRVISAENLADITTLKASGRLSHRQIVLLLVPLADIDAGELVSILRAAGDFPKR